MRFHNQWNGCFGKLAWKCADAERCFNLPGNKVCGHTHFDWKRLEYRVVNPIHANMLR